MKRENLECECNFVQKVINLWRFVCRNAIICILLFIHIFQFSLLFITKTSAFFNLESRVFQYLIPLLEFAWCHQITTNCKTTQSQWWSIYDVVVKKGTRLHHFLIAVMSTHNLFEHSLPWKCSLSLLKSVATPWLVLTYHQVTNSLS